jgi:ribonuclease HII
MSFEPSRFSVTEIRKQLASGEVPCSRPVLRRLRSDPRRGVQALSQWVKRRLEAEKKERLRLRRLLAFERDLWGRGALRVAGVDEVGVGPLAGPVVAAAVVFRPGTEIAGVDDSKRLDPQQRTELSRIIRERAQGVGVSVVGVGEIDRLNIYQAALEAMRQAVHALPEAPEHLLVDARTVPGIEAPQEALAKGDRRCFSIAAASIVAKTHRDALMEELDRRYPGYGLARHKGYGTPEHLEALRRRGPSPVHRRSFKVLEELAGRYSSLFYRFRERLDGAPSTSELEGIAEDLDSKGGELEAEERGKLRLLLKRRLRAAESALSR